MRFRRALYRIWHYSRLFSADRFDLDELEELGEDGVKLIRRQRTAVLSEYPTEELQQLYTVVRFMRGILAGVSEEGEDNPPDRRLRVPPVRTRWRRRGRALQGILRSHPARNVTPPNEDDLAVKTNWILDEVKGANDTCAHGRFAMRRPRRAHSPCISQLAPPSPRAAFLKNKLIHSTALTAPLDAALKPFQETQMPVNDVAPED
ncbi:hypothetical protein K438DRAFT_1779378 [Mycena galopus ATCC 62051]|nr:hypothetical protein K438DRAFT_1779378 [Mycena galopus ATCC 62051]